LSDLKVVDEFKDLSIPHLSSESQFRLTRRNDKPEKLWKFLIDKLQAFRQYRKDKETGQFSKYGASQWTEPNALRYRMNKRNNPPAIDKFPRAEFGLPILFHMPQPFDDFDATLKGKGKNDDEFIDRLSSPLILRPIRCSEGFVGIAIILDTPRFPPFGLYLTDVENEQDVLGKLSKTEAKTLTETLEILREENDILLAFLNYLEQ
jgi:CRISPR-associated protein Cmr1